MALLRLINLEMQIMEVLWRRGPSSVHEILEQFPDKKRPAYTTVKTMVVRLAAKNALRRVRKAATGHIFEAIIPREAARDFEGGDDLSALEESRKHSDRSAIEIWQKARLVA